jgi:hypothetical protein
MSGKAQQGIDYTLTGTPGQVTILAGQSAATVLLHAVADHVTEGNETAIMTLIKSTGYKLSAHPKTTVTIVNGL